MFEEIVIADDGHQGGLDAIALGDLLRSPDTRMVIARAVVDRAADVAIAEVTAGQAAPVGGTSAEELRDQGSATTRVVVRCRSIEAGLHELAAARGTSLLVVGSHHHTHIGLPWFGDHTRGTLRDAPCPVAVAPYGYGRHPDRVIRSIGIGHVDTAEGRAVLDVARDLAWQLGADIHAIRVVAPSNWPTADSGAGRKAIDAARRMAEVPGVRGSAVEGDVAHALARVARTVDLFVVGLHHHRALRRLTLGDVATSLARHPPCALVVVPAPRRAR